ncbi:MAG TPA: DsrE family protein [Bauldia sp.]|nr:DsrE family protein [Bauldia sp.]
MRLPVLAALAVLTILAGRPAAGADDGLVIDVPVVLKEAKVVFNLDHLAFEGDEPTGLSFLRVMTAGFREAGTKVSLVAIFHGDAGYMALDDEAYDRVRKWQGGNPYKAQIAAMMAAGVQFEECGQTMRDMKWVNADLLPGVKVNSGANYRIIELVQQGYVQIQP